jgi:hypothetical protein
MIILLFLAMLTSCGTIVKESSDLIVIDSQFRGAEVQNQDGLKIGVTPFLLPIKRQWHQNFFLIEEKKIEHKHSCSFDYGESLIPNGIFSALTFPYGLITLGIDWYNGKIYKCSAPVFFQNISQKDLNKEKHNVLIVPPSTNSFSLSNKILKLFDLEILSKGSEKFNFIRLDQELASLGIDAYSKVNADLVSKKILKPLLLEKKIDYLLVFEIKNTKSLEKDRNFLIEENEIESIPVLIDVYNKQKIETPFLHNKFKTNEISFTNRILDKIHIIPNSIKAMSTYYSPYVTSLPLKNHLTHFQK